MYQSMEGDTGCKYKRELR